VDSNLAYTPENSVSCCKTCNLVKHVLSVEDFQSWVFRTAIHMGYLNGSIPPHAYCLFEKCVKTTGLGLCH
jgi:hypothetical protein